MNATNHTKKIQIKIKWFYLYTNNIRKALLYMAHRLKYECMLCTHRSRQLVVVGDYDCLGLVVGM